MQQNMGKVRQWDVGCVIPGNKDGGQGWLGEKAVRLRLAGY